MNEIIEQCFIACLMRNPKIWAESRFLINKKHFNTEAGIKAFQIFNDWVSKTEDYEKREFVDVLSFLESNYGNWLKLNKKFLQAGLNIISTTEQSEEKWSGFYKDLDKGLINRKFRELLSTAHETAKNNPKELFTAMQTVLKDVAILTDYTLSHNQIQDLSETIHEHKLQFLKLLDPNYEPCYSGIRSLDDLTSGFGPHSYNLIAARSSMGKSALMGCMVKNMIEVQNKKIIVFNTETTNTVFIKRWASQKLRLDNYLIRNPKLMSTEQRRSYFDFLDTFSEENKDNLFLFDNIYDQDKIFEKIITLYNTHKIDGVFVDLIGYVVNKKQVSENRQREIAIVSQNFLEFRKRYPIFITVLQQMNKGGDTASSEGNSGQANLRESEEPYQHADAVYYIYPHRLENKTIDKTSRMITVDKNRDGGVGSIYVDFEGQFLTFSEKNLGEELTE